MGYLDFLDYFEDDDIFLIKYGLIIANFLTIILLLFFKKKVVIQEEKNVLLVTAHPDDETMFFIPTIVNLIQQNYQIHLLCLSTGNANKLGKIREIELEKCSKYLGITKLLIINDSQIEDQMQKEWPIEKVSQIIQKYIFENKIDGVITFDDYGVSGHINHRSCFKAVKQLENIKCFALESTNIFRKYISIFDFFISAVSSDNMYIHFDLVKVWKAMQIHKSQFVWYRRLFVIFSRYSYINTLRQMTKTLV